MKILVAMPVYDSKLFCRAVNCLMGEQFIAYKLGDELSVEFLPNCSHPAMGRNQLVDAFLKSEFDKIIFLDSDITFEAGSLIKLARQTVDYVGGCYRYKFEKEDYPLAWLPNLWLKEEIPGLIEVAVTPAGFLCLSRKVFEDIKKAHPEREFTHMGHTLYSYFSTPFIAGLHSEESLFAGSWRDTGGKVYLYPDLNITHWDFNPVPYVGNIGNWLKSRITDEQKDKFLEEQNEQQQKPKQHPLSGGL